MGLKLRELFTVSTVMVLLSACSVIGRGGIVTDSGSAPVSADGQLVFFVTDRSPEPVKAMPDAARYLHGRSSSMAFGSVEVGAGTDTSALTASRTGTVHEMVRFPETPVPFVRHGGFATPDPEALSAYRAAGEAFKASVAMALRARRQHDVMVMVHGFHNGFGDSITSTARLWDEAGRYALPIAFSWPAGNPAPFGYFKDGESGEFAIFHLKETLRLLAEVDGLQDIQIVAHSRGTDVVTSALREMVIAAIASGRDPRTTLKVDNLILAAPDLDIAIVRQRLLAEHFGLGFKAITVYMNPRDGALAVAQALMSGTRFGRLSPDELTDNDRLIFAGVGNVHFIDVSGVEHKSSHAYFQSNPRVVADIATLLRTDALPGSPERGLVHEVGNFWRIDPPPKPPEERHSRDDQ